MNKHQLFDIWAPPHCPWSAWAKVAPLSNLPETISPSLPEKLPDLTNCRLPTFNSRTAVVVDLPGPASIRFAHALANIGYRPIVVINAVPQPIGAKGFAVDVQRSVEEMIRLTPFLQQMNLQNSAPPAFVIDALRQGRGRSIEVDMFDNRSVLFGTDFPSASRLKNGQVDHVVLVHERDIPIERDLASILHRWIDGGVTLSVVTPEGEAIDAMLPSTTWLSEIWTRFCAFLLFHRNSSGHFGAIVPQSSGG